MLGAGHIMECLTAIPGVKLKIEVDLMRQVNAHIGDFLILQLRPEIAEVYLIN